MGALVIDLAKRDQPQPVFGVLDIDDGPVIFAQDFCHRHIAAGRRAAELLAVGGRRIFVLEETMQERGMRRIDADLERLQPVAADQALEREGMAVRRDETVDFRKRRRLAFAEPGPENSALLDHRIRALRDVLAQRRILGFSRGFKALAGDVEQPAMEGAAQAAVLETAKCEVGATMRAMALDQAVTALFVAKQHQILAKQFDGFDRARARQFVHQRRRLPVHPHQFPARVVRPGPGHQVVLFLAHHGGVSFIETELILLEIKVLALPFPASTFLAQMAFAGCSTAPSARSHASSTRYGLRRGAPLIRGPSWLTSNRSRLCGASLRAHRVVSLPVAGAPWRKTSFMCE